MSAEGAPHFPQAATEPRDSSDAAARIVDVRNLSASFGPRTSATRVVHDVSFAVDRGQTLAIVGESGSGKTVSSLALMRLIDYSGGRIDSGRLTVRRRDGSLIDVARASRRQMRHLRGADIAMVFQEPMTSLNPVKTVGDQVAEAIIRHQGMGRSAARAEVVRLFDLVRIPESRRLLDRHPHQLSGGMRQRVMIAMALSCKPVLLIADEPTTALDVTIQAQILTLMQQLQREMQMTMIFITHDMGVVAEVADHVLVMKDGRTVEQGRVGQIFDAPEHPYTRALLSAVPRLGSMNGIDLPARFLMPAQQAAVQPIGTQRHTDAADDARIPATEVTPQEVLPHDTVRHDAPPVLEVQDLVTRFDVAGGLFRPKRRVHAVEHLNFVIRAGETLALVGESGSGKSTTGRSLARLIHHDSGEVRLGGTSIDTLKGTQLQALRRDVQFIFQDPFASLDPRLSIGYSILEPMLIHEMGTPAEARRRVGELLERVGLPASAANRFPHQFSGGQRQRIAIARALTLNPKLIIADEAVSALDVSIRAQIINLLLDLQQERGIAYLFISHDMAVVERISHRVAVMYLGQIVEIGPRRAVFEQPAHPYTQRLMSAVPIADPAQRRPRTLMADEIPSPIRALDDPPQVAPLVQVGPDHYVARHSVGGRD